MKKFDWDSQHSVAFEAIKKVVANIVMTNYYNLSRVKCDASHSGLGATLEQLSEQNECVPIAFASRYINTQEKNTLLRNSSCWQKFGPYVGLNITCLEKNFL